MKTQSSEENVFQNEKEENNSFYYFILTFIGLLWEKSAYNLFQQGTIYPCFFPSPSSDTSATHWGRFPVRKIKTFLGIPLFLSSLGDTHFQTHIGPEWCTTKFLAMKMCNKQDWLTMRLFITQPEKNEKERERESEGQVAALSAATSQFCLS